MLKVSHGLDVCIEVAQVAPAEKPGGHNLPTHATHSLLHTMRTALISTFSGLHDLEKELVSTTFIGWEALALQTAEFAPSAVQVHVKLHLADMGHQLGSVACTYI